jgi:hypothetical protein
MSEDGADEDDSITVSDGNTQAPTGETSPATPGEVKKPPPEQKL